MENLDKIVYQKIARKDLSFGCRIIPIEWEEEMKYCWQEHFFSGSKQMIVEHNGICKARRESVMVEIIWHPILLSDVLHFFYDKVTISMSFIDRSIVTENVYVTIELWNLACAHYEEQSEECKEFIRNFCKDT